MRQTGGHRVVAWLVAGLVFAWALPSWAQSWSYRRETDEMTDRTNHFASVRVGSGYRPAVFFAACRNDDLEMWLAPNDYIGSSEDNGPHTSRDDSRIYIDYRVNDEPAQEGRLANLSTDEDAFFFQDHADIIRGLIGKRLIVKWRDYRGTSTTLTIPTRGAAAALKKLPCARPYIPNCGDGETQLGEECDEGRKNSNGRGAVCRRDCTYAPAVCGDGAVQVSEVCDKAIPAADGAEEVCLENVTGFVVRTGDTDAAARRLLQLAGDPALRRRLGQAGAAFVKENFSVEKMVDDQYQVYLKVAAERGLPFSMPHPAVSS